MFLQWMWYLKDENPGCGEETENVQPHVRSYLYHLEEIVHGTHGWVMAHMDESWHTWMSHVMDQSLCCISLLYSSIFTVMSHCTRGWVAHKSWHTWMSHDTHEIFLLYSSVVLFHMREWYMTDSSYFRFAHQQLSYKDDCTWMNCYTRRNESCHIWMSHVTHEWVMSHIN